MTEPTDITDPLDLRPLPGSRRRAVRGSRALAQTPRTTPIEATVVLRRRAEVPGSALTQRLTRDELAEQYGADPADVALVVNMVTELGAEVLAIDPSSRRLKVSGPPAVLGRIFGTNLELVSGPGPDGTAVTFRQRTGELSVPAAAGDAIIAVLGLDNRPQTTPQFRIAVPAAVSASYTPPQVGQTYRFPVGTDGRGQTIAILELGGGFRQTDLDTYFSSLGIPSPSVTAVGVDGATNRPGEDADGEVMLDIEIVGALAPAATIVVYFAPNTDSGFLNALSEAAHAAVTPVAISISWGQREDDWTPGARNAFDQALLDACLLGVTVTAAAGDTGSADGAADGRPHVDFPASSPNALACGGTRLDADTATGTVRSEVVWNNGARTSATGGGVSNTFALPSFQHTAGVPPVSGRAGRGVPDVAGNADPQTGYQVRVNGANVVIGGTSAVSPLWAALLARCAQAAGRPFGLIQPDLYGSTPTGAVAAGFRDITNGDNGSYSAGPGWDPCTGLGVPIGGELLNVLRRGGT